MHESTRAQRDCFALLTFTYNAYPFGVSHPDGLAHGQSKSFVAQNFYHSGASPLGGLNSDFSGDILVADSL